jgi:MoxR-like ATPase
MSHSAHTQADEILSTPIQDPKTGIWENVPSNLVRAYKYGGVFCADEILALKPGPLQVYHPYLNGDTVTIATANGVERIPRHPLFRFFGTGNHWATTKGNNVIGEALMDRCTVVPMTYISEELETEAIMKAAPEAAPGLVADLVAFAALVRNGVKANPERNHYLPSTRMLARLARHISRGRADVKTACETMIFAPIEVRYPDELAAIRGVFESIITV